jgi:elongation factor G
MTLRTLIQVSIETDLRADKAALREALTELALNNPALSHELDDESGLFVLKGPSEQVLDLVVDQLKRHYEFKIKVGAPQVAYRVTFTREVTVDYTHKRLSHGIGEFARVKLHFVPIDVNAPWLFEAAPVLAMSAEFISGVETGVKSVVGAGSYAGFPMQGVKATLIDGAWHSEDSSEKAFEIAARAAMREAAHDGGAALLEPIMRIKISAPERYNKDIEADIQMRRCETLVRRLFGEEAKLEASVPLCMLFKYETALRTMTLGQCSFEMEFSHYALFPTDPPRPPAAAIYAG